jgi:hypothetical protein
MIPQMKNFYFLQLIEYFRLNIEYLWNAVDLKKTERSDSLNIQFTIFNSQFSGGSGLGAS